MDLHVRSRARGGSSTISFFGAAVAGLWLLAANAYAGPIGPTDFDPDAVVLSFDGFAHGTAIADECGQHVILGSTAPIGQEFSADPADSLQPGEAVSPFVATIVAVPASATSSAPNKVIGTKYDAGGGL